VREEYDLKLTSMQGELKKLHAAKREHAKLMRNQTHYETQLQTLQRDLADLKKMKVRLTQTYIQTYIQIDRQTHRHIDRHTYIHTDRQTHREGKEYEREKRNTKRQTDTLRDM